jgi:hypothetical protein
MNTYEIEYVIGTSYTVIIEAESESMARNAFEEEYAASNGMLDEAEEGEVTHEITGIELLPNTVDVTVSMRMVHSYWVDVDLTVSREDFDRADAFGDYAPIIEKYSEEIHEKADENGPDDCEITGERIDKN